ncbi:Protein of unknown function [Pyronema omphalodes CBS 100304]|uniref:Uncharacterized protein n=1 Tax=Pyronema omphalodes (strain CBS 100304) TaxID=1076935 RepID=U4LPJ0_PYROM|nr:Protein of unknown function [Pyronema omphalodes CBS 100304]
MPTSRVSARVPWNDKNSRTCTYIAPERRKQTDSLYARFTNIDLPE